MERDGPITPKTPTASAWWALMEDAAAVEAPFDERKSIHPPPPPLPISPNQRSTTQWSEGFWNLLLAESPSDELEVVSCDGLGSHEHSEISKNQTFYLKQELQRKRQSQESAKRQNNNQNNYNYRSGSKPNLMDLLQCGNLNTATFSTMEHSLTERLETLTDRLEKVESPCKMMTTRKQSNFDEYDDEIYEFFTESGDSVLQIATNSTEDNIFIELQDEIPFLRDRGDLINSSSKYKDILASTSVISDIHEKETRNTHNSSPNTKNAAGMSENVYPISSRKFPVENTIDRVNRPPSNEQYTSGNFTSSPVQNLNTSKSTLISSNMPMKATKAGNPTLASTRPLLETVNEDTENKRPKESDNTFKGRHQLTGQADNVKDVAIDDIIKKISTLTSDGDFSSKNHHNYDTSSFYRDETKICMPPQLLKKISTMRNINLSKTMSSTQSQSLQTTAIHALHRSYTASDETTDEPLSGYDCHTHSYVAFFRRGPKAINTIRLYEQPIPLVFPILDHEVVVRIDASTVSLTDIYVRQGDFWGENSEKPLNLPIVPGVAFSGTISQISQWSFKSGLNVGDRVISLVPVGANARHLSVSSKFLVKIPEEINDPLSLSCLPEIYLSAFQALHIGQKNAARYRKTSLSGKCILVLGGGTALGQALIEVAVAAGCDTVYATDKEKQFDAIVKAGGAPLGRDQHQWCSILAQKINMIIGIDNSIGKSELKQEHVELLARNGRVILLCRPDLGIQTAIDLDKHPELSRTGRKLLRYNVFDSWEEDLKQGKRDMTHLVKLFGEGLIRPKIIERIPLCRVAKAQDLMEGKKLSGFVLCEPWIKGRKRNEMLDSAVTVYAESASKSSDEDCIDRAASDANSKADMMRSLTEPVYHDAQESSTVATNQRAHSVQHQSQVTVPIVQSRRSDSPNRRMKSEETLLTEDHRTRQYIAQSSRSESPNRRMKSVTILEPSRNAQLSAPYMSPSPQEMEI